MKRRRHSHTAEIAAGCFAAGVLIGWWLHASGPIQPVEGREAVPAVIPDDPVPNDRVPRSLDEAIDELRRRHLRLPLDEVKVETMKGEFAEQRSGHSHEAVDMLAPRDTPVHAVEDGTIAKLFFSKAGGNTIYQFDPTSRFCYYYAHLERYATGISERKHVSRGDVIGYVGTSGNAPPNTPHLHFSVFLLGPEKQWWRGTALDPYLVFAQQASPPSP
ncbi:MAG TPA: M23 family metallopeptidase [Vicinamibacterales bacterium]